MLFQIWEEREGMSEDFIQSFSFLYFLLSDLSYLIFPDFLTRDPNMIMICAGREKWNLEFPNIEYCQIQTVTELQWGLIWWGYGDCQTPVTGPGQSSLASNDMTRSIYSGEKCLPCRLDLVNWDNECVSVRSAVTLTVTMTVTLSRDQ